MYRRGMTAKALCEKLASIALAIVLMAVGCGPGATQLPPAAASTPVPPAQTPAPTATTALAFPTGVFAKSSWTWEFKADGTWILEMHLQGVEEVGSGTYTVAGDRMTIVDIVHSCKDTVGTYAWTHDGEVLTLTEVDDKCRDRAEVVRGKWRPKP